MANIPHTPTPIPLSRVRTALLFIFALTLVGLVGELLLIGHTEGWIQKVPLVLLGLSALAAVWIRIQENKASRTAFRTLMVLLILGGTLGIWKHYSGNVEFELEMYPSLSSFELFWESIRGATPVLAPGAVIGLGLTGWLYTWLAPGNISELA